MPRKALECLTISLSELSSVKTKNAHEAQPRQTRAQNGRLLASAGARLRGADRRGRDEHDGRRDRRMRAEWNAPANDEGRLCGIN